MANKELSPALAALIDNADSVGDVGGIEALIDRETAEELHNRIVSDIQMVNISICNLCRDLKEMRNGEYYKPLGYDTFGDYTETVHGIGERQAYKYIRIYERLGDEFLNSSSKIGVTKLNALAMLNSSERDELLSDHSIDELADMSVDEVKALTEKVRKLEEQISMFENAEPSLSDEQREALELKFKTELDKQYADDMTRLKNDLLIERGQRAEAEEDSRETNDKFYKLSNELSAAQRLIDSNNLSPLSVLEKYNLSVISELFSNIRYGSTYYALSSDDKKVFVKNLLSKVEFYFGKAD